MFPSQQIEFARLNLTYTVTSKRKLAELVQKGMVTGWDDPRMPTLAGMRRRGYTPEAIRAFCERIGVAKTDSIVDVGLLEHGLREDLNRRCPRVMAVLRPLKVVIENFPEGEVRELDAPLSPEDPGHGHAQGAVFPHAVRRTRRLPRGRPQGLVPPGAPAARCACATPASSPAREVIKDAAGQVIELRCTWDPQSWGGNAPDGRTGARAPCTGCRPPHAVPAEVRLYDRLFSVENPGADESKSFLDEVNPESLVLHSRTRSWSPTWASPTAGTRFQFERLGYFCLDPDSAPGQAGLEPHRHPQGRLGQDRSPRRRQAGPRKGGKQARRAKPRPLRRDAGDAGRRPRRRGAGKSRPPAPATPRPRADPRPRSPSTIWPRSTCAWAWYAKRAGGARSAEAAAADGRRRRGHACARSSPALRAYYPDPAVLVGRRVVVVANLKPRQMKFGLSEGMILAGGGADRPHEVVTFVDGPGAPQPGDKIS